MVIARDKARASETSVIKRIAEAVSLAPAPAVAEQAPSALETVAFPLVLIRAVVLSVAVARAEAALALVAREARQAWVADVLAEAVAVVEGGGNPYMSNDCGIAGTIRSVSRSRGLRAFLILLICSPGARFCGSAIAAQVAAEAQSTQQGFASPQSAAEALIRAAANFDVPALKQILGPDGDDLISSGDPVKDKSIAAAFAADARERHRVLLDTSNPKRASLLVGYNDWPMPIPIVQKSGKWYFDTKAGKQEIIYRRIGANELDAIQVCRGFVNAQEQYALQQHGGVNQYAQRIISSPGKQDGLAWQNSDGTWGGPVGPAVAKAIQEGYSARTQPFHGYYFKVLKGQGPDAPLGKMNFVVDGVMIGGFALAAAPAQYRITGVYTFIVSYQGVVYQKDLGPDTLKTFQTMDLYNPDSTWRPTKDNW